MLVDGRWRVNEGVHFLKVPGQAERRVSPQGDSWCFEIECGGPNLAGHWFTTLEKAKEAAERAAEAQAFRLLSEQAKQVLREVGLL